MTIRQQQTDATTSIIWQWLQEHNPEAGKLDLDLDVDIIEDRIVTSLNFVNFIFFLEDLSGLEIELNEETQLDSFRTLRAIHDSLFGGKTRG